MDVVSNRPIKLPLSPEMGRFGHIAAWCLKSGRRNLSLEALAFRSHRLCVPLP